MTIQQHIVTNCKVFIDESFLLDAESCAFLHSELLPAFERDSNPTSKLILPQRVHNVLLDIAQNEQSSDQKAASHALEVIAAFTGQDRLDLRGEDGEVSGIDANTGDLFVRLACQFQLKYHLAFLTGNPNYARAVLGSNQAGSISNAKTIHVLHFNPQTSVLEDWENHIDLTPIKEHVKHNRTLDLATLTQNAKIFIDTSSLMSKCAEKFFHEKLMPLLRQSGNKAIIAQRVIGELNKHINRHATHPDTDTEHANNAARTGLSLVNALKTEGLADVRHEDNEVVGNNLFFDALVQRVFIQHQKNTQLLLITQDRKLAEQILQSAQNLGATDFPPQVGYINELKNMPFGELGNWAWRRHWSQYRETNQLATNTAKASTNKDTSAKNTGHDAHHTAANGTHAATRQHHKLVSQRVKPFSLAKIVYQGDASVIAVNSIPTNGEQVTGDQSGPFQIMDRISEGGEGIIYKTSLPGLVCKIYLKERLTTDRHAKLERMVSRVSPFPTICWPKELVRNLQGEFVGYLMPLAKGEIFNLNVFKKPLLEASFPHWQREHLVQLGITTLTLIKKLHDLNVLIGDINPNNFMVVNENEVYLVDTDSFQIEEFPCPVGTPQFTPPELIGQSYADFLRTKEHEVFAVSTLLFMILFPGKAPYSGQGAGDIIESIRNHKFPYVTKDDENSARPFGPHKHIWNNLHHFLRQDFREIFYEGKRLPSGGDENKPSFRSTKNYVELFLNDLHTYLAQIRKGHLSNEIFPHERFFSPDEEAPQTFSCCEPGCNIITKVSRDQYNKLTTPNRKLRCDIHFQINRLRIETQPSRPNTRPQRRNGPQHQYTPRNVGAPTASPAAAQHMSFGTLFVAVIFGLLGVMGVYIVIHNYIYPQSEPDQTTPSVSPPQDLSASQPPVAKKTKKHHHKRHHKPSEPTPDAVPPVDPLTVPAAADTTTAPATTANDSTPIKATANNTGN